MCLMTLGAASYSAMLTTLPGGCPFWSKPLILLLHLLQPIVRGWHRHRQIIIQRRLPELSPRSSLARRQVKKVSSGVVDLYWESDDGVGRERLLDVLVEEARSAGWSGDFGNDWKAWDVCLSGDLLHDITIRTATEELGWPRRYTRARCTLVPSLYCRALMAVASIWSVAALLGLQPWAMISGLLGLCGVFFVNLLGRQKCRRSVAELFWRSGRSVGLRPVYWPDEAVLDPAKQLAVELASIATDRSPPGLSLAEPQLVDR